MPTMIDGRGDEIKILHDGPGTEDGGGVAKSNAGLFRHTQIFEGT